MDIVDDIYLLLNESTMMIYHINTNQTIYISLDTLILKVGEKKVGSRYLTQCARDN